MVYDEYLMLGMTILPLLESHLSDTTICEDWEISDETWAFMEGMHQEEDDPMEEDTARKVAFIVGALEWGAK